MLSKSFCLSASPVLCTSEVTPQLFANILQHFTNHASLFISNFKHCIVLPTFPFFLHRVSKSGQRNTFSALMRWRMGHYQIFDCLCSFVCDQKWDPELFWQQSGMMTFTTRMYHEDDDMQHSVAFTTRMTFTMKMMICSRVWHEDDDDMIMQCGMMTCWGSLSAKPSRVL